MSFFESLHLDKIFQYVRLMCLRVFSLTMSHFGSHSESYFDSHSDSHFGSHFDSHLLSSHEMELELEELELEQSSE